MKKENGKARVLNKTEFNRVVKYQSNTRHGFRNVLLLHLSFFIGLRSKEMSALTVGDLIDVNGDLKEEVTLKRHQTKRNKQRRFYLTNDKLKKVLIQFYLILVLFRFLSSCYDSFNTDNSISF